MRRPGRIRIGYLSCDFHEHATAFLMAEMLERHDHQRFEIFAYSFSVDNDSATRRRVIAAFDHFIQIDAMPHEAAIRKIREDGIDILVDLKGYTRNARPQIMAGRPAPLQVNYLGYPGTMGADCIDYLIADEFIVPADQQKHFSEKLVYLPHSYQPNDTRRSISARGFTRSLFGLPENGFVFCSFNGNSKITPSFFDVWMRLLKNTPASVLWLLETGSPENLRREAAARGVALERIVFAPGLIHSEHLARMARAAGLPLLTCAGKAFIGRVAGSLLHSAGLPELVTSSLEEYEATALHLAQNPAELRALRERLAQNRKTAPLFDIARFTRNLETAYQTMWDRWQGGLPPRYHKRTGKRSHAANRPCILTGASGSRAYEGGAGHRARFFLRARRKLAGRREQRSCADACGAGMGVHPGMHQYPRRESLSSKSSALKRMSRIFPRRSSTSDFA